MKFIAKFGSICKIPWYIFLDFIHYPNVIILFKSGNKKRMFLLDITVSRRDDVLREITWVTIGQKPMFIKLDSIEMIYLLRRI